MSRVFLACPEPLGHGQPAGVGIRFLEMAGVLQADGHDITILSPDGGTGSLRGCRGVALLSGEQAAGEAARTDVIVVQGHLAHALLGRNDAPPAVVDLYDPFIVENLHYYSERGEEVFHYDQATLMTSIANGDFFLCASEAQRLFYLGVMLAAGRLNPAKFEDDPSLGTLLAIAPFGVPPPREPGRRDLPRPEVLFGGIYDWYDPIAAIETMLIVRESFPDATLTFTHHPNPETTPQGKLGEAMRHAAQKRLDFVRFEPWAPYERRAEFFQRFSLALLTFPRSIETDLSMRTRIYDYLWSGLPIVTSSAPGTDDILSRYGAGSPMNDDSPESLAAEVVSLLREPERHAAMVRGAQQFVRDHQWTETLAPLRRFCSAPVRDATRHQFASLCAPARPPSFFDRIRRRLRA
jgi:glycosyltransferase involved in cell wall biosynthesis